MQNVAVVGAGLVGSLQAILLAKRGFKVDVYERRPDLRKAEILAGRSINLALSDRGWKALDKAGISDEIRKIAIPMFGRKMHAVDGTLTYQPYGKENQAIFSVSRGGLNQKLMNLADDYPEIGYYFNMRCEDIDFDSNTIRFTDTEKDQIVEKSYDAVFATDGAFSAVRNRMMKYPMFDYSQSYLSHGYKELVIPPNEDGSHKIDKNCLHIWPRGEFMMIALANLDGSFTVTLFFPMEGELSFASIDTPEKVKDFFEKTFPDSIPLMPTLLEDYFSNPTSTLVTVRCNPWNHGTQAVLMGDAAHAVVPFYGQGMNAGFEDCTVFDELLEQYGDDWNTIFSEYSRLRVPDGNAIADLALNNYIEMRDSTADPDFLLRKKIERKFSDLYPNDWMPLYEQVTFSHIRYSDALKRGQYQRGIMDEIMQTEGIYEKWDSEEIMNRIAEKAKTK
ncbi:NAD(P)/FAD-dependent oxidoreductase [Wandonia haliotis]|uniref:Kynurenine 3-monooxygenase n=1 Tax=Wandonia haliotis TaxID=574963 RepID=A0ABP3Y5A9_9FLAO